MYVIFCFSKCFYIILTKYHCAKFKKKRKKKKKEKTNAQIPNNTWKSINL